MSVPNKYNLILVILINLSFFQNVSSKGIVSIPFVKEFPELNNLSPEKIPQKLMDNIILSKIRVGTPPQSISLKTEFAKYISYIGGNTSLCEKKFFEDKSESYIPSSGQPISFGYLSGLSTGINSSDYFYLNENSQEKINMNFILGIKTDKNIASGNLGLNIKSKDTEIYEKYNFINMLKSKELINNNYFTIKYKDNKSGNLIIGDKPHKYNNSYNEKDFREMYISLSSDAYTWNINFSSIYVGNNKTMEEKNIVGKNIYGFFKLEYGIILGTENYRQYLLKEFMREQINKNMCYEVNFTFYISYYCKKDVDISKIKNLYINSKELDFTFELNYKDLFYQNEDGNNYFLIIFNNVDEEEEHSEFWSFGEPLIKKYNLIFNPDSKQIGIYAKLSDFDNKEETFWEKYKWYIILVIALIIILVGLGVMIFLYLKVLPRRKKKANELNDDFDYPSNENKLINES